jgi:hypothetical protein
MSYTGKVRNGVVVLPPGVKLPDGAEVQVNVPEGRNERSFAERYAVFVGIADDLPADLAANLDHYLHGHPKQ